MPLAETTLMELYHAMFDQARHGILLLDGSTARIQTANPFVLALLARSSEELVGQPIWQVPLFRELESVKDVAQLTQTRSTVEYDDLLISPASGPQLIARVRFSSLFAGGSRAILCEIFDLSGIREREIRRRLVHTMEALGRMASRVAAEFDNVAPLVNSPRAVAFARDLSAFAGTRPLEPEELNLDDLVESMIAEIRSLLGDRIDLVKTLETGSDLVWADPWRLRDTIRTLTANARAAMPDGGILTIATAPESYEDSLDWSSLTVSHNGRPLEGERWSRLFEPFSDGGSPGEDCAFGLATAYAFVKRSGGHIAVSSGDSGTCFRIYLPRAREQRRAEPSAETSVAKSDGSEAVVILESEDGLRSVMRNLLSRKGYQVLEARNEEEVRDLRRRGEPIRLVLASIASLGSGGMWLARQAADGRSGIKLLYIVGPEEEGGPRPETMASGAAVLRKPFRLEALLEKVREVLE
jgi:signal transduction histidine kinase